MYHCLSMCDSHKKRQDKDDLDSSSHSRQADSESFRPAGIAGRAKHPDSNNQDQHYMKLALNQAICAAECDEVPVGAVLVKDNKVIAAAYNNQIKLNKPTAHAEVLVMEQAGQILENYRLPGCTLYVTLEPCLMCVGAMIHARIDRLVFAAHDPKTGMAETVDKQFEKNHHNHRVAVTGGVLSKPCGQLIQNFFRAKRLAKKIKQT